MVVRIREQILQGGEEERAELPLLPIDPRVDFVLDQVGEKALGEVLRIVDRIAPAAHESVERRPISLAKLCQGGSRRFRFRLLSPAARITLHWVGANGSLWPWIVPGRGCTRPVYQDHGKRQAEKVCEFLQRGRWNPFGKGKRSSLRTNNS